MPFRRRRGPRSAASRPRHSQGDLVTKRVALITGASRGIGAAIARALAEDGYSLTLSARHEPELQAFAQTLREQTGTDVHVVAANMAHEDDVRRLATAHAGEFDRLDLLVLNAGVGASGTVAELLMKRFDLVHAVNLRAPYLLVSQSLPLLRKTATSDPQRGAKIVALSSITGVVSEPQLAAYGASKAALISLYETLNLEESGNGVAATAISPGYVDTDMAAWQEEHISRSDMLPASDVAELVVAVSRLSSRAVVPNIVLSRRGDQLWRA
ncbi:MAG: SDR family NAD(P)-dependent oxidoreductase [Actinophytocola sp.]|nr:SDR family NAD(P)-dependent oxidoreductase [Actinophytocola sp.]